MKTPTQIKAMAWFCTQQDLRPQLSSYPVYDFITRDGKKVSYTIYYIVEQFKKDREELARLKKRKAMK